MMVQDPTKQGPWDVHAISEQVQLLEAPQAKAKPTQSPSSNNGGAFAYSTRTLD